MKEVAIRISLDLISGKNFILIADYAAEPESYYHKVGNPTQLELWQEQIGSQFFFRTRTDSSDYGMISIPVRENKGISYWTTTDKATRYLIVPLSSILCVDVSYMDIPN